MNTNQTDKAEDRRQWQEESFSAIMTLEPTTELRMAEVEEVSFTPAPARHENPVAPVANRGKHVLAGIRLALGATIGWVIIRHFLSF